jgi:homoserine dehydrogenase
VQRHLVAPGTAPQGGKDAKTATGPVPVILITYATTEDAVRRALAAVKADQVISGEPQLIRIEKNR